jgi:hypothetical protein
VTIPIKLSAPNAKIAWKTAKTELNKDIRIPSIVFRKEKKG